MKNTPILLVPGWWLGAWAWDEVAAALRADGHDVTALTLPGLEESDADRSSITMADHVAAIVDAVQAADSPVVLAVHSGSGFPGYAASDRVPDRIAAMVYVDTGPGMGAPDADFEGVEKPLPSVEALAASENLDGIPDERLAEFRRRAVPQPGGVLREAVPLANDARLDIPTTVICTAFPSHEYQEYARDPDMTFLAGLRELRDISWIDLPTGHWPMWSRPGDLAEILGRIAAERAPAA